LCLAITLLCAACGTSGPAVTSPPVTGVAIVTDTLSPPPVASPGKTATATATASPLPATSGPAATASVTPSPAAPSPTRPTPATRPPTATATALPPAALPEPFTVIKAENAPEVYLVVDGVRRHIPDWDTFLALGFESGDVVTAWQTSGIPQGPRLTRLLKGSDEPVYWMDGGVRHHIPDMETFRQLGYREEDVSLVPDRLLIAWPLGEPVPSVLGTPPEPVPPPSGERVALSYHPLDPGGGSRLVELYTVNADGHDPSRLSFYHGQAESLEPAWSPDGQWIAFTGCSDGSSGSCAARITGHDEWQPVQMAELMTHRPVWSPPAGQQGTAGTQLAFWSSRAMSVYTVDVVETADGPRAGTVRLLAQGRDPAWTPDGRIAFWAGPLDDYTLMVMDASGENVEPVSGTITVLDQHYYPWHQVEWSAAGDPFFPGGR
jgi:hypothetical protein